jgi:hypothetical protein
MMKVLQLIQREGEHQLVLELFESYLAAVESSKPNQLNESAANKGQGEFEGEVDATQSDHANDKYKKRVPLIYGTVIKSLGELGEIDLLLSLLRDELPSRGYHIRRALYGVAMTGCNKHMKYNEALELFYLAKKVSQPFLVSCSTRANLSSVSLRLYCVDIESNWYRKAIIVF